MSGITKRATDGSEHKRRILSAIREQLQHCGYYSVRRITCEFAGEILQLRGRVPTYYEKQIAQSIVLAHVGGEIGIENHLHVGHGQVVSPMSSSDRLDQDCPTITESNALLI